MLTYLWKNNSDGKYYGLDGSVYNTEPTLEQVAALQTYSRQFVNDSEGYENAFNQNVANRVDGASLGESYSDDSSCQPLLCGVNVVFYPDDGGEREASGNFGYNGSCYQLNLYFKNLVPKSGESHVGREIRYANSFELKGTGGCYLPIGKEPISPCYSETASWIGICFYTSGDTKVNLDDPLSYAWIPIASGGGTYGISKTVYAFKRTPTIYDEHGNIVDFPKGGNWDDPTPTNGKKWYLSVTGNTLYPVWMSIGTVEPDWDEVRWEDPQKMSDTRTFQTEWASGVDNPSADTFYEEYIRTGGYINLPSLQPYIDPTNVQEGINEEAWRAAALADGCGKWSDYANNARYMAMSNYIGGKWKPWSVVKIEGNEGAPGESVQTIMAFANVKKDLTPVTPSGGTYNDGEVTGIIGGDGVVWKTDNEGRKDDEYTWLSSGNVVKENGATVTGWSKPVRITGDDGIDGTDSDNREFIYRRFRDAEEFERYKSEYTGQTFAENVGEFSGSSLPNCYYNVDASIYQKNDFIPTPNEDHPEPTDQSPYKTVWQDHPEGITEDMRLEACSVRVKSGDKWVLEKKNATITADTQANHIAETYELVDTSSEDWIKYYFPEADTADTYVIVLFTTAETETEGEITTAETTYYQVSYEFAWGDFSVPFVWSSWGDDGIDGDGVEYIYCITTDAPCEYVEVYASAYTTAITWVELEEIPYCEDRYSEPYILVGGIHYAKKYIFPYPKLIPPDKPEISADTADEHIRYDYYQEPDFVPGDKVKYDKRKACGSGEDDGSGVLWDIVLRYKPEFEGWDYTKRSDYLDTILCDQCGREGEEQCCGWDRNWTDNPLDVGPSQPYEWVCIRKYKHGTHDTTKEWGEYSEPSLWNHWAFDGTSVFTSMVFCRTNDDIGNMDLCGGIFEYPMPGATGDILLGETTSRCEPTASTRTTEVIFDVTTSTSKVKYLAPGRTEPKYYIFEDTVPMSDEDGPDEAIWMSTRIFGDDDTGENQGWTSPTRMTDSADFNVEWCTKEDLTQTQINAIKSSTYNFGKYVKKWEDVSGETPDHALAEADWEGVMEAAGFGKWSDTGDKAVWMATTTCHNGRWTNWTVSKIKGEKGDAGIGLNLLGSTFLVTASVSDLMNISDLPDSRIGGYIGVVCAENVGEVCTTDNRLEIFRFDGYSAATPYIALSCEIGWRIDRVASSIVDEVPNERITTAQTLGDAETIRDAANASPDYEFCDTVGNCRAINEELYYVIHVTDTDYYYKLWYGKLLNESDTIIINGIEEYPNEYQKKSAEELAKGCDGTTVGGGVMNGDFFVWDGDSWRKTANLSGQASYVHMKFADYYRDVKVGNDQYVRYYRLTLPDETHPTHGEVVGEWMGIYVDSKKGDRTGIKGDDEWPCLEGTGHQTCTATTREWVLENQPYQFEHVGNDGLGYEYIYILSIGKSEDGSNDDNARPWVPMFTDEFYKSTEYQTNDWYPGKDTPIGSLPWINGTSTNGRTDVWTDNARECNTKYRYRWRCYRQKINGVWGPFVGDKSTADGTYVNGKYSIFETYNPEDAIICDFDNDYLPVHIEKDTGKVLEDTTYVVKPSLSIGDDDFIVTGVTCDTAVAGINITTASTSSGATVTVEITDDFVFGEGTYTKYLDFTIAAYNNNFTPKTGVATLTVIGVKSDTIYNLVPSLTAIKVDALTGDYFERELTCDVLKKVIGGETSTIVHTDFNIDGKYPTTASYECYLRYSVDGGQFVPMSDGTISLDNKKPREKVVIEVIDNNNILNDRETIYVQADGVSAFQADFDNENEAIPLTYEGAVERTGSEVTIQGKGDYITITSNVSLYYGRTELVIDSVKARLGEETGEGTTVLQTPTAISNTYGDNVLISAKRVSVGAESGKSFDVTFYFKCDWECPVDVFDFAVLVKGYDSVDQVYHIASMTVSGVKAGQPGEHAKVFNIHPNDSVIVQKKDGTREPATLTCYIQKREGSGTTAYTTVSEINSVLNETGYKIYYSKNDEVTETEYTASVGVNCQDVTKNVNLILRDPSKSNKLVDSEKVLLVTDGYDGNGIVAHCQYYVTTDYDNLQTVNNTFSPNLYGVTTGYIYNGKTYEVSMIGSYIESSTSKIRRDATGTVPIPTPERKFLWRREITWYSIEEPYLNSAELITEEGKEISGATNYYVSGETRNADTILGYWNSVKELEYNTNSAITEANRYFSTTDPTGDLPVGYSVWAFTIIYYNDNTCTVLPLTVTRSVEDIKDLERLTNLFGEAHVQAEEGAYLREFIGVMSSGRTSFDQGQVRAFLNANNNWSASGADKGILMFASGVQGLPNSGDVNATTKIWEGGLLECKNANVEGTINASAGTFGNSTAYFNITNNGLVGMSNGTEYFKLGTNGLTANSATITGEIHAESGNIGCLNVDSNGNISHSRNTASAKIFEITNDGVLTCNNYVRNGNNYYTASTIATSGFTIEKKAGSSYQKVSLTSNQIYFFDGLANSPSDLTSGIVTQIDKDGLLVSELKNGSHSDFRLTSVGLQAKHYGDYGNMEYMVSSDMNRLEVYAYNSYGDVIGNSYMNHQQIATTGHMEATNGFYQISDARFKNLGEPLKDVLSKIDKIDTVYYTLKDDEEKKRRIGTTAQSLLNDFPEFVSGSEEDKYTVDYAKLSVLALAAIKELKAEINDLKEEIKQLKENK